MASNLPSSFSRITAAGQAKPSAQLPQQKQPAPAPSGDSSMPFMFLSILALLLSIASFWGAFYSEGRLSDGQKDALKEIAEELRSLQSRDIALAAPVTTTVRIDEEFPTSQMFPETFTLAADFEIPVDTQLIAVSGTGQTVSFRVQESIPVKASIPINSKKAFGNATVKIDKDLPVDTRFSSVVKVRAAYGKELGAIIEKLDALAGVSSSGQ